MELSPTLKARFEANIGLGPRGCIEWKGCVTNAGYGQISVAAGVSRGAHVVAWFLAHGFWPKAILHECDNRLCVTAEHMRNGTKGENNRDTAAKRRFHYGTDHHNGVLTDEQVLEIRVRRGEGELLRTIAIEFGVSQTLVSQIYHGKARRAA